MVGIEVTHVERVKIRMPFRAALPAPRWVRESVLTFVDHGIKEHCAGATPRGHTQSMDLFPCLSLGKLRAKVLKENSPR